MSELMIHLIDRPNSKTQSELYFNLTLPVLLLLIILGVSAWVRFDNITHQGMLGGDGFKYLKEATLWAKGNRPDFLDNQFYRPLAYFLQGMALKLFGFNDYSVKLLHGLMDLLSILLIFIISTQMTKNYWTGLFSSLLYAFIPDIVRFSRYEMLQTESTFFGLLACFLFILFINTRTPQYKSLLFLALSGFTLGLTTNIHADLAFLGPGYVLILFIHSFDLSKIQNTIKKWITHASIFTGMFFTPYAIGFILFGFKRVIRIFLNELYAINHNMVFAHGRMTAFEIFKDMISSFFVFFFRDGTRIMVTLVCGMAAIIILRIIKKEKDSASAYLPLILLITYMIFYSFLVHTFADAIDRVLIPLFPFLIISITYWYYVFFKQITERYSNLVLICFFTIVFFLIPTVQLDTWKSQKSHFRALYDVLKNEVNENSRVLIAPASLLSYNNGFRSDLYFGNNADYQVCLPMKDRYDLEALINLLESRNIRYIYIGNQISPAFIDAQAYLDKRKYYREWLRNPNFQYTLNQDLEILHQYIRYRRGKLIHQDSFGSVYDLNEAEKTYHWIEEGSFDDCDHELPAGTWELKAGKATLSDISANGSHSICLEPEPGKTITYLIRYLSIPSNHVKPGSKVTVFMDVKADPGVKFSLSLMAYNSNNTWEKSDPPGIIIYEGQGQWQMLSGDFIYSDEIKSMKMELLVEHKDNTRAFIDNLSIINIDN